jgi:cob(I)alamin adenosyltransferase
MKIYTKTGDKGQTALYGGERVDKDAARVMAYGTVDELNACLGLARAHLPDHKIDQELAQIQNTLFDVGADLATPSDSPYRKKLTPIDSEDIALLEGHIDRYDEDLMALKNFILPGGHEAAAALHLARAVARRAEREVVSLGKQEAINADVIVYLNRLSDYLFTLTRIVNMKMGVSETKWQVKGRKG